jgi:hypothetical protein
MLYQILNNLVSAVVFVVVTGLLLWFVSKIVFKFKINNAITAFIVSGIAGAVAFVLGLIPIITNYIETGLVLVIFVINAVVLILLIKRYYKLAWDRAILAWLLVFVLNLIIGFLIGIILGLTGYAF